MKGLRGEEGEEGLKLPQNRGMAAGEAGRRRYSHKELTQELTHVV